MNPALLRGIYLRGNVYWLAIQKDRKRHFVSLKTSDLSEAIRNAAKQRHGPTITSGAVLLHSIERFVAYMRAKDARDETGGWAKATADSKRYVLETFAKWAGNVMPAQITSDQMRRYYDERVAASSASTAFGNLMTVRSFFNWCRDVEKSVRENPCVALKITAPNVTARKNFCSPELVAKLIEECPREDLKFVLFCGFHAGLRALEIVEAVPWWFDLESGILHLRKTPTIKFKDREERSIPLTGKFLAFIRDEYGLREPYMLHPENEHGKNRYRYDFTRPFREYMKAVSFCCGGLHWIDETENGRCPKCKKPLSDCGWISPHTMRRSFASILASAGHSIYKIAVYLGDGVRVVQKHYARLLPEAGALDAAFKIDKGLPKSPKRTRDAKA